MSISLNNRLIKTTLKNFDGHLYTTMVTTKLRRVESLKSRLHFHFPNIPMDHSIHAFPRKIALILMKFLHDMEETRSFIMVHIFKE